MASNLWIHGLTGSMGQEVFQRTKSDARFNFVGGSGRKIFNAHHLETSKTDIQTLTQDLNKASCIIDFSLPEGHKTLLQCFEKNLTDKTILICTTGLEDEISNQWQDIAKTQGLKVLLAPNTSLGILQLVKHAEKIAKSLHPLDYDIEIEETHHRHKADAPSGTALFIASAIEQSIRDLQRVPCYEGKRKKSHIGIHASRGGGVFGEHKIRFLGDHEEVTISHRAFSRSLFAQGALTLCSWLLQQQSGYYDLLNIDF